MRVCIFMRNNLLKVCTIVILEMCSVSTNGEQASPAIA